jgi:hypothetical protein
MFPAKALFFLVLIFLTGCGDSLLEGLGNKDSTQSRQEEAQHALDKGECAKAVPLFDSLHKEDPNNMELRLDLSAAYLCQAGFSVQGFLKVAAESSKDQQGAESTVFKKITDTLIPDKATWKEGVCQSKALLGKVQPDGNPAWPCYSAMDSAKNVIFFNENKDAGYILTIVNLADATLTVVDVFNTINSAIDCAKAEATTQTDTCHFTVDDLLSIGNSLLSAQRSITAATGEKATSCSQNQTEEVSQTTYNMVCSADGTGNNNGELERDEVLNYLVAQKIITNPDTVKAENCTYNPTTKKYTCT